MSRDFCQVSHSSCEGEHGWFSGFSCAHTRFLGGRPTRGFLGWSVLNVYAFLFFKIRAKHFFPVYTNDKAGCSQTQNLLF